MDTKERNRGRTPNQNNGRRAAPRNKQQGRLPENQRPRLQAPKEEIPEVEYTPGKPLRRGRFLLRLLSVATVAAALIVAVSMFFKVDTVTVLGADQYTAWQIRAASGIEDGDGLLTLNRSRAVGKIKSNLPYVDKVKISIELPGTVQIEVTEFDVAYAIETSEGGWWLISSSGEAVESVASSAVAGYTQIQGVIIQTPEAGETVRAAAAVEETESTQETATEESETGESETEESESPMEIPDFQIDDDSAQKLEVALIIAQELESNGVIGEMSLIDVTDLAAVQMRYGQRIDVKLGGTGDLTYKIRYMAQAVSQLEDYQSGELDLTFELQQQGIFTPEN